MSEKLSAHVIHNYDKFVAGVNEVTRVEAEVQAAHVTAKRSREALALAQREVGGRAGGRGHGSMGALPGIGASLLHASYHAAAARRPCSGCRGNVLGAEASRRWLSAARGNTLCA